MECPKCNGSGTIPCFACSGTGEETTLVVLHPTMSCLWWRDENHMSDLQGLRRASMSYRSPSLEKKSAMGKPLSAQPRLDVGSPSPCAMRRKMSPAS